jgi:hypothetical protein
MVPGGLIEIERGEVGGVPAYWPEGAGAPHRVALGCRVGYADETLPEHGITHLVEHLALFTLGRRLYDTNGVVGARQRFSMRTAGPRNLPSSCAT